jgi:glycosyltransferase involved in cell wall biosynthesis
MNSHRIEHLKLSILIVTYNHERFITKALDSLLNQNFDCSVEVIIADDGSSDNTLAIIKDYEGKDSRFKYGYLDKTKNLGITKNYQRGFAACSGEYVAVLEGDDYWISPFKLRKQADFLDEHLECDLCSVNYFVFEEDQSDIFPRTLISSGYRLITARDLIEDNLVGNFSTCMYRKSAINKLPRNLFEICSYDWIVNICIARNSFIGFLNEPMSVYRLHSEGVWSQMTNIEKMTNQIELIPQYDELTEYVFHENFEVLSNQLKRAIKIKRYVNFGKFHKLSRSIISRLIDYLPPVLLTLASALTPPKLKRLIVKIIKGDAI